MVATPPTATDPTVADDIKGFYAHFIGGRRVQPDGTPDPGDACNGVFVRSRRTVQVSRLGALKMSVEAGGAARFQNVYGPREILGAGRWRGTYATVWRNVVPTFAYRALKGLPLRVEGDGAAG